MTWLERLWARLVAPQPLVRLELVRILVPLAVLLFLSSRIAHVDDWIGVSGFHVPELAKASSRQPLYLAPLAPFAARALAVVLVASGLGLAAGALTRVSGALFTVTLLYANLIDRLSEFTVSKIGVVLALALTLSPAGARWSVDALSKSRRRPGPPPTLVRAGYVRAFQLLLVSFYLASGIAKWNGDWPFGDVIYSQIHDSYQTVIAYGFGRVVPAWGWLALQTTTLAYEMGAPLWFGVRATRPFALVYGLTMHATIGLMFGPLIWFSLLMMSLLVSCFAPAAWLEAALARLTKLSGRAAPAAG
jgi:Vitamin K-dependent gamma-carboxylase